MSRFYASIDGQAETQATRRGGKKSGIGGHIRGWDIGVKVYGFVDAETGEDTFQVYLTGGSNGTTNEKPIGMFTAKDLKNNND